MGTTIKDVARLANVSVGTVSQVINNKGTAGEKSSKRVLDAIAKLKYRTNHYAKSLVTSKSSTIGLIVPMLPTRFSAC